MCMQTCTGEFVNHICMSVCMQTCASDFMCHVCMSMCMQTNNDDYMCCVYLCVVCMSHVYVNTDMCYSNQWVLPTDITVL